jgi:hypothetical protein
MRASDNNSRQKRASVLAWPPGLQARQQATAIRLFIIVGLLIGSSPLVLAQFAETETILPFSMKQKTVPNPAYAAWNAAPSNPCGSFGYCLHRDLDLFYHTPRSAKAVAYVFHGGSGSARMWITGEEEAALIGDLVRTTMRLSCKGLCKVLNRGLQRRDAQESGQRGRRTCVVQSRGCGHRIG